MLGAHHSTIPEIQKWYLKLEAATNVKSAQASDSHSEKTIHWGHAEAA